MLLFAFHKNFVSMKFVLRIYVHMISGFNGSKVTNSATHSLYLHKTNPRIQTSLRAKQKIDSNNANKI